MSYDQRINIGIIGCGNISEAYLTTDKKFNILNFVACADIDVSRAQEKARQYGALKACSVEELLANPEVEIVLNLTPPAIHFNVGMAVLRANKSVYNEKPLATNREDGWKILETASLKGLRIGCAPDTFLGAGLQTCRKIIDDGLIGEPVAATAFMMCRGHESWHPEPEFYYQPGGGPMFDMGPYYLTALVTLLGPARRVTGSTRITFPERIITSQPKNGEKITVKVPTHVAGIIDFCSGPVATIITSFDVWSNQLPRIEIYGTNGTLSLPDPNTFGGPVWIRASDANKWNEVPLTHGYADNSRGVGVVDMSYALRTGRNHRANGELAYHVLDIMEAIHEASLQGRHIDLTSSCERPLPLTPGLTIDTLAFL